MTILPNIITIGNLLCGLSAIAFALKHEPLLSAHMIFFGMVLDFLDGKIARFTHSVSHIGTYLDSIADIVSFGIAPVILTYVLCPADYKKGISFFLFLYAASGVFRLVRYTLNSKIKRKETFSGIPIPAAAGSILSFMLIYLHTRMSFPYVIGTCIIIFNAVLMSSTLPYQHLSKILKNFPSYVKITFLIVSTIAFLSGYYYAVLFLCFMLYTVFGIKWHGSYETK